MACVTMQRNYTSWMTEATDEETRAGQEASYERWVGKHIAQAAIAEYDGIWKGHHGNELITKQSVRRFASQLADDSAPSLVEVQKSAILEVYNAESLELQKSGDLDSPA